MLSRVDRVQLIVKDPDQAVRTWVELFGAELVGRTECKFQNARVTTVRSGCSEFDFLQPTGPGRVADWAAAWSEGLYGVGFATQDLQRLARHLDHLGCRYAEEGGRLYIDHFDHGMPTLVVPEQDRQPVGHIRGLYEVTNVVADWRQTEAAYRAVFDLDASRFCPIRSELYGYEGTLTLFNPPQRLDRIEITQAAGDGAMARFFRRRGSSLYMCYIETDDVEALARRLAKRGARFAPSEAHGTDTGLFIHPSAIHGMLMGVSRTHYAWSWSGRPELAGGIGHA